MRNHAWPRGLKLMLAFTLLAGAFGCRNHYPHMPTLAPGPVVRTHAKPIEGGYYSDFDPYAVSVEVQPVSDVNPVGTQHVLVATVRDENGRPLPNRRVEWIIAEGSVGDFVEVDESGWRASRGHKVDNHYAITHTNNFDHVLTRGTDDPSDDIHLKAGDSWAVITSPIEGTTHVIAYVPGIYDWDKHKVFVTKHWLDVAWEWPPDATNPTGDPHTFTTTVTRHSDGTPLEGYIVNYEIISGPPATFTSGGTTASVRTDAQGQTSVTMNQSTPQGGVNEVKIDIIRPEDKQCCRPATHIACGIVRKAWIPPEINITKDAPARATVDEQWDYNIMVSNPSRVAANDVIVSDVLPDGIQYHSSSPSAQVSGQSLSWSLGTIEGGAGRDITVRVSGMRTGRFDNCAEVRASQNLSDRDCAETIITAPALALEKTCQAEAMICDLIPYKLVVRNTGDGAATNVMVEDTLPNGLETEDGKTTLRFDAGTLEPGQAKQATYNVRANRTGNFTNTSRATADDGLTAEDSCSTTVTQPELQLTKTGPNMRFIGRPTKYDLTVSNTGDSPARDTVIVDQIPAGTSVLETSDGGQVNGGQITWSVGTLNPGQSRTVSMTLKALQAGTIRNTATARAVCADASAEAQTTVEGVPAILLEVIDVDDPIEIGNQETYQITVTNQGTAPDTNIEIVATLPVEMEYISANGPTAADVQGKTIRFAPLASLAPGAKLTYTIVSRGVEAGDTRFHVRLTSDQIVADKPVEETESTHVY